MDSFPTFVTVILLLLLLLVPQKPLSCQASNDDDRDGAESPVLGGCGIAAIYNFGDSFSNTGNALAEYPDGPMGNFPNGMTIHNATGRFCDGHLIIDHIAEAAGLPYLNPYLRKNLDQSKGTNFAVGGVGLLSNKTRTKLNVQLPFSQDSVDIQLNWLEEHLNRTFGDDETARRNHLKSSLFVFTGGSGNDYTNIRGNFSSPPLEKMKAIIPDVVAAVKNYLKLIIEYGASKIVVTGLYKAGCTVDVGLFHDYKPRCNTSTNAVAALHNRILKQELAELRKEFPGVLLVYGDMWGPTGWLLRHYRTLGFKQPSDRFCCGNGSKACGSPGSPYCQNPQEYMFWDDRHLTDHSYRVIANLMIPRLAADLGCDNGHHHALHTKKPTSQHRLH